LEKCAELKFLDEGIAILKLKVVSQQ